MHVVKFYRTIYFYTQKELADLSGLDQYRISRIEGGADATDEEWQALADAFGMTAAEMRGAPCSNTVERYLRSRGAVGHANGIPEAEILRDLGITERHLRSLIQKERINNQTLICHDYDEKGYYIAATGREMQRFLNRHMGTIRTLSRECKAFRDELKAHNEAPGV